MDAGKLDRRVTLERFTETRDELNNPILGWAVLTRVWGAKTDVSDTERYRSSEIGTTLTTRFVIRWSNKVKDVNSRDRLTCEGEVFNIIGVKEIGRRQHLEITASSQSDVFNPTPEVEP